MSAKVTTRLLDWAELVAQAEHGPRPQRVAYEFSNGRRFLNIHDMNLKLDMGNGALLDVGSPDSTLLLCIGVSL